MSRHVAGGFFRAKGLGKKKKNAATGSGGTDPTSFSHFWHRRGGVLSEIQSLLAPRGPSFVLTNEKISTVFCLIKIQLPDCGN